MRAKFFGSIAVVGALVFNALFLTGCGTASTDSKHQIQTGVSVSGYPAGQPRDAGSPALASSTESNYSRDQAEAEQPSNSEKK